MEWLIGDGGHHALSTVTHAVADRERCIVQGLTRLLDGRKSGRGKRHNNSDDFVAKPYLTHTLAVYRRGVSLG
jgi:hypothetical protein